MRRFIPKLFPLPLLLISVTINAGDSINQAPRFMWADETLATTAERTTDGYSAHAQAQLQQLFPEQADSMRFEHLHDTGNGPVITSFQAYYDNLPVFGRSTHMIMERSGQLVAVSGQLPDTRLSRSSVSPEQQWRLQPEQAVSEALDLNNHTGDWQFSTMQADYHVFSNQDQSRRIRVKPVYMPSADGLTPAYYVETGLSLSAQGEPQALVYVLSARDGSVLASDNRVDDYQAFSYRVFTDPQGEPFDDPYGRNQAHPTGMPDGFLPDIPAPQQLITTAEQSTLVDDPWLPDNAEETVGNNVDAFFNSIITENGEFDFTFTDPASSAEFRPQDGDFRARITSPGNFDHSYDELSAPSDYLQLPPTDPSLPVPVDDPQLNAKIVNGFYVINYLHDLFYDAGFDEAAGNAQQDNFGRGGIEGDPIVLMTSFPFGIFIVSLGDGESPQVFQGINPFSLSNRDATMDFAVIGHEWGHYIVRRLVGGSTGFLTNKQGGALNEGWADFIGVFIQVDETDSLPVSAPGWNRTFASGAYVNRDFQFFTPVVTGTADFDTYYHGVRRYPYSVDMQRNPLTLGHIADGAALPANIPVFDWRGRSRYNTEVHAAGEVWANALWECYNGLLNRPSPITFQQKRSRMAEYLVASMKVTPFDPTYTEARNALLSVIKANDHQDFRICKQAMAKRGLGAGAVSPPRDSRDMVEVRESFSDADRAVSFISAQLDDSIDSDDNDGLLDAGERGQLNITLRNTGFRNLPIVIARLQPNSAYQTYFGGFMIFWSGGSPGEDMTASIPIRLLDDTTFADTPFTLRVLGLGQGQQDPVFNLRTHYDLADTGTMDSVETLPSFGNWAVTQGAFTAFHPADPKWKRAQFNNNFVYQTKEGFAGYQSYLTSPELQVSDTDALIMSFDHAYKLDKEPDPIFGTFKGQGSIEFSIDDGLTWNNVNTLIATQNDFIGTSAGYPQLIGESLDFGTDLAGLTVQFRFFADFRETFAEFYTDGWFVDNISFTGINNTPFTEVLANGTAADSVVVSGGIK